MLAPPLPMMLPATLLGINSRTSNLSPRGRLLGPSPGSPGPLFMLFCDIASFLICLFSENWFLGGWRGLPRAVGHQSICVSLKLYVVDGESRNERLVHSKGPNPGWVDNPLAAKVEDIINLFKRSPEYDKSRGRVALSLATTANRVKIRPNAAFGLMLATLEIILGIPNVKFQNFTFR
jgi:hypothetical protein